MRTTVRTEEEAWAVLQRDLGLSDKDVRSFNPHLNARLHVYFVQALDGGPIKVGVAKDVQRRIKELQCACPVPLRLLGIVEKGGLRKERELHQRFAASRLHGEWFEESHEILACISELREDGDLPIGESSMYQQALGR